ncbi:extracellular solute-binding protein [Nitrososphaera sp. AFS]|uniref:extracellular solute-binding protein n=1 Tax=Nitrososphaera sp. AFS TaxID=2301191 RepID=UPI00139221A9|nr:extracellular solute-binding protein [Nitrososphaera sp. AFS]NAL78320.1 extracellular solute-binding protein [Nitrososphaera sp. AFS]
MRKIIFCPVLAIVIASATVLTGISSHFIINPSPVLASLQPKQNVSLAITFNDFNNHKGKSLLDSAIDKLRSNHPNLNINVKYVETSDRIPGTHGTHDQLLKAIANGTSIDVVTIDQIWLGEFAQKGYMTDLTNRTTSWGKLSDFYGTNLGGMTYNHRIYGIWAWTDVRGIWYWKDLLNKAGVDPNSLKTWGGYIESARKLNSILRPQGIEGVNLAAADQSSDVWYPYLWMLGGQILTYKNGHPFPAYNSSAGVKAMEFIKAQIDAGIKPQNKWLGGKEFANRNFSVMIDGSWMPSWIPKQEFSDIGFIPMFPVPSGINQTSTMMGGWEFGIPKTSTHKDLAWELIKIMLEPDVLSPWIATQGLIPTQISIGQGPGTYAEQLRKSIPFFDEMVSMIPHGQARPSVPEYPAIAQHIRQAIDEVSYGLKDPKQALQDAAAKSAKVLGW